MTGALHSLKHPQADGSEYNLPPAPLQFWNKNKHRHNASLNDDYKVPGDVRVSPMAGKTPRSSGNKERRQWF